jgi:hypothetical protein
MLSLSRHALERPVKEWKPQPNKHTEDTYELATGVGLQIYKVCSSVTPICALHEMSEGYIQVM